MSIAEFMYFFQDYRETDFDVYEAHHRAHDSSIPSQAVSHEKSLAPDNTATFPSTSSPQPGSGTDLQEKVSAKKDQIYLKFPEIELRRIFVKEYC